MTLENLVGKGLEHEPPVPAEIQRLLKKADTRIKDARSEAISNDSRFDIAYEGVLQLAVCALRANGFRLGSKGGHHVIALQSLSKSIGYPKEKIRLLDEFRRQRSIGLYDGSFDPTNTEVETLLQIADDLQQYLKTWLKEKHPNLCRNP